MQGRDEQHMWFAARWESVVVMAMTTVGCGGDDPRPSLPPATAAASPETTLPQYDGRRHRTTAG